MARIIPDRQHWDAEWTYRINTASRTVHLVARGADGRGAYSLTVPFVQMLAAKWWARSMGRYFLALMAARDEMLEANLIDECPGVPVRSMQEAALVVHKCLKGVGGPYRVDEYGEAESFLVYPKGGGFVRVNADGSFGVGSR
jgi:hypothetical protein